MPPAASKPAAADRLGERWHRALLDELCGFGRETASAGEHAAAQWLVERLATAGAGDARVEEECGVFLHDRRSRPAWQGDQLETLRRRTRRSRLAVRIEDLWSIGGTPGSPSTRIAHRVRLGTV